MAEEGILDGRNGLRIVRYWPALLGTALNLTVSVWTQLGGSKQSEVQATSSALKVQGDKEDNDED